MQITITFPTSNIRQLIRWDNPIAIADGYCASCRPIDGEPIGQFTMCPMYITDLAGNWENTWSENQMATPLSNAEWLQISLLQTADEYTTSQKMNWLGWGGQNTWGAPIRATYPSGDKWMEATNIKLITAVYADQFVEIIGHQNLLINFNNKTEVVGLSQIRTYPPSEWDKPMATQFVTAVNANNEYQARPKGLVKLPIYFGNRLAWVFDRWLVP
jgi:hypothetical protein